MKPIVCFNCSYSWKPRKAQPKVCPWCGSPHWKAPSLSVRLRAAWRALFPKPQPRIKRVVTGKIIQLPEGIATDFQEAQNENT